MHWTACQSGKHIKVMAKDYFLVQRTVCKKHLSEKMKFNQRKKILIQMKKICHFRVQILPKVALKYKRRKGEFKL